MFALRFQAYCNFSSSEHVDQLDNTRMGKMARESGIVGTFAKKLGDVDVLFATVKGASLQKISFAQFRQLLMLIGGWPLATVQCPPFPQFSATSLLRTVLHAHAPELEVCSHNTLPPIGTHLTPPSLSPPAIQCPFQRWKAGLR